MKQRIKFWLRRWILRTMRLLFDAIEERLHDAEVRLREEIAASRAGSPGDRQSSAQGAYRAGVLRAAAPTVDSGRRPATRESFATWEARRGGALPAVKAKPRRARHFTAADFDRRFA
jgi:hypothetical protein